MQDLHYLENKEINKTKWDSLVDKYAKGFPYAYSWYLDSVCDNWNIIIYKDYKAGFAFQINKKMGLPYSLNPFLVQQLGFLGGTNEIFSNMINEIKKRVFHFHYHLYFFNQFDKYINRVAPNNELILDKSYNELSSKFKTNTKRNLKKASNNKLSVTIETHFHQVNIDFINKFSKIKFDKNRLNKFKRLMTNSENNNALEIYSVIHDNQLISMVIFIKNIKRSVYLMSVSNPLGKELKANFLIVDKYIENNADTNIILDFEGSSINGIARFYQGFGAKENNYQIIKNNSFKNSIQKFLKA
jgi:hypothetical protein